MRVLYLAGGIAVGIFLTLSGADFLAVSVLGAGAAHCISEMIMLRTETENQKFFSSESRATMVSAGSMAYSIFMTVLSPGGGDALCVRGFCSAGPADSRCRCDYVLQNEV